jgi:site-specific DNA recombinase
MKTQTGMKPKAAGYIRVSTAGQIEGESLETQRKQITSFIEQKDWDLAQIYADEGQSGAKIEYRTEFQQMIIDAKAGEFEVIVFYKLSRFARNAREYQNLSYELEQHGVQLASVKENIDPTTKTGKMIAGILSLFAEWEHETIREQMLENRTAKWKDQRVFIGKPPFGYTWNKEKKKLEINDEEASLYKRIVNMYINQRLSFRDIAIQLNGEGLICKNGKWSSPVISYIFKNPCYYGYYVVNQYKYEDGKRGAGTRRTKQRKPESETITFPIDKPIISKTEWDKIQLATLANKVKTKRNTDPSFFLRDVLVCSRCGGVMKPHKGIKRKDGSHLRYYRCYWSGTSKRNLEAGRKQKCTLPVIKAETIENAIWVDIRMKFAMNPKKAFEHLISDKNIEKNIKGQEEIITRLEDEKSTLKRVRQRIILMLRNPDLDIDETTKDLRENKEQRINNQSHLNSAYDRLKELQEATRQNEKIISYINENKKQFAQIRKDINKLSYEDKKLLVEAMLIGKVVVDYEEPGCNSLGGANADFKIRFNPDILQRFADEGKIKALNNNSWNYFNLMNNLI